MLELKRLSIVITKVQCKYTILHENKKSLIKSDYLCYAPIYYKKNIKNLPWYYHYEHLYEDERKKMYRCYSYIHVTYLPFTCTCLCK